MISDEMLRIAAEEYEEALLSSLPEDAGCDHAFSPGFERKMRRLCHRVKYASVYSTLRRVACAVAVLVLSASMLLLCSTEVRAAMFGWVKEVYKNITTYSFAGEANEEPVSRSYDFAQVPEGYVVEDRLDTAVGTSIFYRREDGAFMELAYEFGTDGYSFSIISSDRDVYSRENIEGQMMEFYLSTDPNYNSMVLWTNDDHVMFSISAKCDKDTLIELTKKVQEIK